MHSLLRYVVYNMIPINPESTGVQLCNCYWSET